jgi:hypothetical protein
MATPTSKLAETKRLMGALLRMKPKPHEDMKLGKEPPKRSGARKREKTK